MKWTENFRVSAQDTDFNRVASASAIMRFMQDTANYHMEGMGPSYDEMFDSGRAFIIGRFAMVCPEALHSHDDITVQTWAAPSRAASFNRCYSITRDTVTVAGATSVWALVNTADGSLIRVEDSGLDYGEDIALEIPEPLRFRIPRDAELREVGVHTVSYTDVDVNRHMNNTKYADMLCSFIDMTDARVHSLAISYTAEAPLGSDISVLLASAGNTHYFRTVRNDGKVNIEAKITLGEI